MPGGRRGDGRRARRESVVVRAVVGAVTVADVTGRVVGAATAAGAGGRARLRAVVGAAGVADVAGGIVGAVLGDGDARGGAGGGDGETGDEQC
jgi:hypothetical protein